MCPGSKRGPIARGLVYGVLSHAQTASPLLHLFHLPRLREESAMERLSHATEQAKVIVKLPSKWLNQYSDFITKNAGAVGQVEGALRSLTYIIPGISISHLNDHCLHSDFYRPLSRIRDCIRISELLHPTPIALP